MKDKLAKVGREPTLEDVLGFQIARAAIHVDRVYFQAAGQPLELRPVEYTILSLIAENTGLSQARLADMLAVTAPNITVWINRLVKRDLVTRVVSKMDRRAQVLGLTERGLELTSDATRRIVDAEGEAFSLLSATELLMLKELLSKVAKTSVS